VRRALTWAFALPLMLVGSQVAHEVAYWWAYPQTNLRLAVLEHTGHSYLGYAPIALAGLGAIEALVFATAVVNRARGRPLPSLPPAAFLFLPAVAFVLEEYLERLVVTGTFPWWTASEPTFWRGVVLQLPFGLAAYLVARLLLRAATVVARVVRAGRRTWPAVRPAPSRPARPRAVVLPKLAPLAGAAAGRAPPPLSM
jgi:hypothetical protein